MFGDPTSRRKKNNQVVSIMSGFFFALGWWLFIDAVSVSKKNGSGGGQFFEYLPGIVGSLGFFLINNLPHELFVRNSFGFDNEDDCLHKTLLLLSTVMVFGSTVASVWIMASNKAFEVNEHTKWRGLSSVFQNFLILVATFMWRFFWKPLD